MSRVLDIVDLVHSGINLQWIKKTSCIKSKCKIVTYKKKQNINQIINQKNVIYNQDLKRCGHISFEVVGTYFGPE